MPSFPPRKGMFTGINLAIIVHPYKIKLVGDTVYEREQSQRISECNSSNVKKTIGPHKGDVMSYSNNCF